jgi:hypothetical protein
LSFGSILETGPALGAEGKTIGMECEMNGDHVRPACPLSSRREFETPGFNQSNRQADCSFG